MADAAKEFKSGPSLSELERYSEISFWKRVLRGYFLPKNYEASIKRHRRLGAPVVRKVVVTAIFGPIKRIKFLNGMLESGTNYSLDRSKPPVESVLDFALKPSIINEVLHTGYFLGVAPYLTDEIIQNGVDYLSNPWKAAILAAVAIQPSLISLQRYNRARFLKLVDKSLQNGKNFSEGYTNWAGIDSLAMSRYEQSIDARTEPEDWFIDDYEWEV